MHSQNQQELEKLPIITLTPPDYLDDEEFQAHLLQLKKQRKRNCIRKIFVFSLLIYMLWAFFLRGEEGFRSFDQSSINWSHSTSSDVFQSNTSFDLSPTKPKLFLKVKDFYSTSIEHLVDETSELKDVKVELSSSYSNEELFRNLKVKKVIKGDEEGVLIGTSRTGRWTGKGGQGIDLGIKVIYPKGVKIGELETFSEGSEIVAENLTGIELDGWKARVVSGGIRIGSLETKSLIGLSSHFGSIQATGLLSSDSVQIENHNGRISTSNLQALETANLHSSMGEISGQFSSPSLTLQSQAASLRGVFNVSRELKLKTKMGSIDAKINLVDEGKGISIESNSEQGRNHLEFLNGINGLNLETKAESSLGRVEVKFNQRGFQGDFTVETNLGSAQVEGPGEDEKYEFRVTKESKGPVGRELEGWISKKDHNRNGKGWGKIEIKTKAGSALLKL